MSTRRLLAFGVLLVASALGVSAAGAARAQALSFAKTTYGTDFSPSAVAVADFDRDGIKDFAVASYMGNTVAVRFGAGDATFGSATSYSVGNHPIALETADFDRDGDKDLAVVQQDGYSIGVLLNDGAGGFSSGVTLATGDVSVAIVAADLNGDDAADLAVADNAAGTVDIFAGDGAGGFAAALSTACGQTPTSIDAGDFDADGDEDLAVTCGSSSPSVVTLVNGGGLSFTAVPTTLGTSPDAVCSADFDGDGTADLAVGDYQTNEISTLLGSPGSTLATEGLTVASQVMTTLVHGPAHIDSGDLDRDGNRDVVVAGNDNGTVGMYLGNGDGSFSLGTELMGFSGARDVAIADLDRDGKQDVVVVNNAAGNVAVLRNLGGAPTGTMTLSGGAVATRTAAVQVTSAVEGATAMSVRDADGAWGAWQPYSSTVAWTMAAGDGTRTVEVRYRNGFGELLTLQDDILLDTVRPATTAQAVSVIRYRKLTFKFKVTDATPGSVTATVTIKIKNRAGTIVKTLKAPAAVSTNIASTLGWSRCTLAKGTYRYTVYAVDAAGNKQSSAGSNSLVVK